MVQRISTVSLALVLASCSLRPVTPPVTTVVNRVEYITVPAECLTDFAFLSGEIVTNGDLLLAYKNLEQQLAHYRSRLQCVRDSQRPKDNKNNSDAK